MAIGRYKLARQIRRSFYADVILEAEPSMQTIVVVSDSSFAWLRDEYGPNAGEWPVCQDYRRGAIFGTQYALAHTARGVVTARITITRIHAHPAHSDEGCIAYACCFATWDALGVQGHSEPTIGPEGVLFETSERPP